MKGLDPNQITHVPDDCTDYYHISSGYLKPFGNMCQGGISHESTIKSCPRFTIAFKIAAQILAKLILWTLIAVGIGFMIEVFSSYLPFRPFCSFKFSKLEYQASIKLDDRLSGLHIKVSRRIVTSGELQQLVRYLQVSARQTCEEEPAASVLGGLFEFVDEY